VAIVSHSGATAHFLAELAWQQDLGLSIVAATGTEADLDTRGFG
jgi:acyl-CoA synthetase (NDP forming)